MATLSELLSAIPSLRRASMPSPGRVQSGSPFVPSSAGKGVVQSRQPVSGPGGSVLSDLTPAERRSIEEEMMSSPMFNPTVAQAGNAQGTMIPQQGGAPGYVPPSQEGVPIGERMPTGAPGAGSGRLSDILGGMDLGIGRRTQLPGSYADRFRQRQSDLAAAQAEFEAQGAADAQEMERYQNKAQGWRESTPTRLPNAYADAQLMRYPLAARAMGMMPGQGARRSWSPSFPGYKAPEDSEEDYLRPQDFGGGR